MGDAVLSADQVPVSAEEEPEAGAKAPSANACLWAMLIARVYEVVPLVCRQCGGELKIVAFLAEADPIQCILMHIGEPAYCLESRQLGRHRCLAGSGF